MSFLVFSLTDSTLQLVWQYASNMIYVVGAIPAGARARPFYNIGYNVIRQLRDRLIEWFLPNYSIRKHEPIENFTSQTLYLVHSHFF